MVMQDHIHTFEDLGAKNADHSVMTFRQFLGETFLRLRGRPLPPIPPGPLPQRQAYINWGRWVVDCPNCNASLNVTPTDVTAICPECGTAWFEVVFPPPGIKVAIETILLKRPGNRGRAFPNSNWNLGETVGQLRTENLEHGLGI